MSNVSSLSRSFLFAVAASSISIIGCGSPASDVEGSPGVTQANLADFDGESLFRGLVMMDGEAGDLIPEIRQHFSLRGLRMSAEARNEISESEALMIEVIHSLDPEFFHRFEEKIRSGEHEVVADALQEGSRMLLMAARKVAGYERFKLFFEAFPITLIAEEYLPEGYEGRFVPSLEEFLQKHLLDKEVWVPELPENIAALDRGYALDAAVDVNWVIDHAVNIHVIIDVVRAVNLARVVPGLIQPIPDILRPEMDWPQIPLPTAPMPHVVWPQRPERPSPEHPNRPFPNPLVRPDRPAPELMGQFQVVILEKMVDSIVRIHRAG